MTRFWAQVYSESRFFFFASYICLFTIGSRTTDATKLLVWACLTTLFLVIGLLALIFVWLIAALCFRRFCLGVPAQVQSIISKCRQVEVAFISALSGVLQRIIVFKGFVVSGQYISSDDRARRADDKVDCINKSVSKQWLSTYLYNTY